MSRITIIVLCTLALLSRAHQQSSAQSGAPTGGRINNLKVLSDKIDDVTTTENIIKSFIKPGMSDAERAKALWTAAVKYRHQTTPPNEYLSSEWEAHDPVKLFNVYGYCMCCCASSIIEALNRLDGREARGRILNGHSVPEVMYDGAWHMYDCSLINLFPTPDNGSIASVDEVTKSIKDWYASHPGYEGNSQKIFELMKSDGWMGWKANGPSLLANDPYYKMGYLPARTHGWDATMLEYNRNCEVYEYGYEIGHRALFSLRPGESLVRDAGNRGLHVNMEADPKFDMLSEKTPHGDLAYVTDFDPGYNGGVVANGYHRYTPDLAAGGLAAGADLYDNLDCGGAPALHLKSGGKPGVAVFQMSSPYVYLGGRIHVRATRGSQDGDVQISISTNNARSFTDLWHTTESGANDAVIDLKDRVLRRYSYWIKVEIRSPTARGAGLNEISVENDIQHAPRTLPWLGKGANTITVSADSSPQITTRSIVSRITNDPTFNKNETTSSLGVTFDNLRVDDGSCWWTGGVGRMTVPIETLGDITGLRFGAHVRARGERDKIRMLLSYDGGTTWSEAAVVAGPTAATTRYFHVTNVPPHTRKALLKYELTGNNTVGIFTFRVDADYKDPLAASNPNPFMVVYRWKENGELKSNRAIVNSLPFRYSINVPMADPEMVSVSYEMAAK